MAAVKNTCEVNDALSVNAQLCAFLQQHPPTAASCLHLDSLSRYPLPVLTGATAADVAGLVPRRAQPVATFESYTAPTDRYDGDNAIADAVHSFWRLSDMTPVVGSCHTAGGEAAVSHAEHVPSGRTEQRAVHGAAWLAQSPFRVCAKPFFHAQLRRCATLPSASSLDSRHANSPVHAPCQGAWSLMDALCHGFSAADGDASPHRKRLRTASAVAVAPPLWHHAADGDSSGTVHAGSAAVSTAARGVRNIKTVGSEGEGRETPTPSPALRSRVMENDSLLGMLLGESRAQPTATAGNSAKKNGDSESTHQDERPHADQHRCFAFSSTTPLCEGTVSHTTHTQGQAVPSHLDSAAAASQVTTHAEPCLCLRGSVLPSDNGVLRSSCTVKELREICTRLGLLSTGSKSVLLQRIQLYESSLGPAKGTATEAPLPPPLPRGHSGAPDTCTLPPPMLLSDRSASGSPPRTIFRYRSPSASHDASTVRASAPAGPTVADTGAKTSTSTPQCSASSTAATGNSAAASTTSGEGALPHTPAVTTPARHTRRVVPSPTAFLQQLMSSHQQQLQMPASLLTTRNVCAATQTNRCMHDERRASPLASPIVSRAREDAIKNEMHNVRWQWLVDFRERAGAQRGSRSKHEGMMDLFRRQQVPCTSVMLPCGDFMLAVDLSPKEAAELQQAQQQCSQFSASQAILQRSGETNELRDATGSAPTEQSPALGHVCSLVVERKTAADLEASVKGSRYTEQCRLLAASPYALVVWVIEGTDVGGGGKGQSAKSSFFSRANLHQRHGGSRSPSPVPDGSDTSPVAFLGSATSPTSTSSPAASAQQRVASACASLGLRHGGWLVVRTRNTMESVQFLKQLAMQMARQLAGRRLHHREALAESSSASSIAVETAGAMRTYIDTRSNTLFRSLPLIPFVPSPACASTACVSNSFSFAFLQFAPTQDCLQSVSALQRRLRAQTAFPRMLMCVRGCSPSLAALLSNKYGSFIGFWKALRIHGREACDADPDIRRLSTAQKKVFILLTEFLLAKDYY
ncbi:hypothetical protein ABL78_1701 [Leptomonas seymouri]|uniref:Crossover junction endonuclease MUS81 n=1 Tax=Leptomonas seymouri TaxID=5684 RepID=A0A0N1PEQ9_LEPSE|nr:hypothetical protein ABL78_1701 [Leptomonas seymouri]|eukprot:KPI89208.1 hypothetical protein ABL78_1701 [Leptomonas seymouri]